MAFRSVKNPINLLNMDVFGDHFTTFWVPSVNPSMRAGNLAQPAFYLYFGEIRGPRKRGVTLWLIHALCIFGYVWLAFGSELHRVPSPWTIILSSWTRTGRNSISRNKILSSLDDNIIVLGRGRDGNVLALDDNIIVLGR